MGYKLVTSGLRVGYNPNSMCCDFCQHIFMNMKEIRKHFASEHSSEYKIADITSVTTHCQEFVIDIDI